MSEEEIEIVAEELAKVGGTAWYPGREKGPLVRLVSDRYRDRAKIAIAALERHRAKGAVESWPAVDPARPTAPSSSEIKVGSTVVYRPPGDRRAYTCRVEKIRGDRAYLVPDLKISSGWVPLGNLGSGRDTNDVEGNL
ncbi:MAG: hypothetical protein ABW026_06460 [Microvirga sp.]